jgi:hypothetical protein
MPRTRCRRICYRPGRGWPGSRAAPRSGPGSTGSPPAGAWTRCGRLAAGRPRASRRPGWTARLIATAANRQPAFGFYVRDPQTGVWQAVGLLVLSLSGARIRAMTRFDAATLPGFGLSPALGAT